MTTLKNGEATTVQPVEQIAPQADQDDQPRYPSSDMSHSQFMARVAENKAKFAAMSPEELDDLLGMGGPSEGVGPEEAMRRLEEIESGRYDSDSEEDDEAEKFRGAEGGKPEVTDDKQDGKDKTSPEAGGAQDHKEKAAKEKQGSEDQPAS